jgi:F-type H+-transporting ATPase subunit b
MKIWAMLRKRRIMSILVTAALLFGFVGVAIGSGGGDEGAKGWVATDTYRVMNFLVLAIGLFFILRKPVSQALSGRINGIKKELGELEAKKQQAEKALASYNKKLAAMEQEAEEIVAGYIKQGEQAKVRILEEAEAASVKLEEQARRNIEHEFDKAKANLRGDVLEKALQKAEAMIQQKINSDDQERLVDDYLKKVVA